MANIFLIHGAFGHPNENWFPYLKAALEIVGHTVFVPTFPTPEGQTLENWSRTFAPYIQYINTESILIGHSLGPAFILHTLEQISTPIRAAYFVAGFIEPLDNDIFDTLNHTFIHKDFDWEKIKSNCTTFHLFHSDNDPYVPITASTHLAAQLHTTSTLIPGAGHFNTTSGYTTFPQLLDEIKKELT